jgi:hypothetical protein
MTVPGDALHTDSAAQTSALTVSVIKDQAVGSFVTMFRLVGPVVGVAIVLALIGLGVFLFRRVAAEVRRGRRTLDPRPLFDPSASDVLGEW